MAEKTKTNRCRICIHGNDAKGYHFEVEVVSPGRPRRTYVYHHMDRLMESKIDGMRKYRPFQAWGLLREKARFVTRLTECPVVAAAARHEQMEFNFEQQQ